MPIRWCRSRWLRSFSQFLFLMGTLVVLPNFKHQQLKLRPNTINIDAISWKKLTTWSHWYFIPKTLPTLTQQLWLSKTLKETFMQKNSPLYSAFIKLLERSILHSKPWTIAGWFHWEAFLFSIILRCFQLYRRFNTSIFDHYITSKLALVFSANLQRASRKVVITWKSCWKVKHWIHCHCFGENFKKNFSCDSGKGSLVLQDLPPEANLGFISK